MTEASTNLRILVFVSASNTDSPGVGPADIAVREAVVVVVAVVLIEWTSMDVPDGVEDELVVDEVSRNWRMTRISLSLFGISRPCRSPFGPDDTNQHFFTGPGA